MKNHNIFLCVFLSFISLCTLSASAQNNLGKTDDIGRIVLSPFVASNSNVPAFAESVLNNKLQQVAAKNGVAGNVVDRRFVITANLMEMSKDITPTAPPKVAITLSPSIYIGDLQSGTLYASCQLPDVKGVGNNDTKAYLNAIKNINVSHPEVVKCIEEGKVKIVEFYNSQIDFLIAEAESMVQSQQFDEAMAKLAAVPDVCKDAYTKAVGKIGEIYQKKIDLEGLKLYNEAYAQWNTAKTKESAEAVVELLAQINPLSSAAAKGRTLVKSVESHYAAIAARRREIEERNWAFKMQQYNDNREDKNTARDQEHEYKMQKSNFDYEVQMEQAKNGAEVYKYALQEVKGVVNTFCKNTPNVSESSNTILLKVKSWFN